MADDLTRLAENILKLDKGVETKRAELTLVQRQVAEAEGQRNTLNAEITSKTKTRDTLAKEVAELTRDVGALKDTKADLTEEIAGLSAEVVKKKASLTTLADAERMAASA